MNCLVRPIAQMSPIPVISASLQCDYLCAIISISNIELTIVVVPHQSLLIRPTGYTLSGFAGYKTKCNYKNI